jgi:hypothetical protein
LKRAANYFLPQVESQKAARHLHDLLGEIELEMTRTYTFFDTYADVLSQRLAPGLGPSLAGCDVIAHDALYKDHPALAMIEPPIVFCDRGFGASVLREGVMMPDNIPNPMPLIQIPYSRLNEKYNLTSIIHEAAHEAMVRLNLVRLLPKVFHEGLQRAGASPEIRDLYCLWASEIGPDFWGFCASGLAQTGTIRDILSLPRQHVLRVSWTDPHPPPYIRVLISIGCCRYKWGHGVWDEWENDWVNQYPLENLTPRVKAIINQAIALVPVITGLLFDTRYQTLGRRSIKDLFDLEQLNPTNIKKYASITELDYTLRKGLSPCAQFAIFRLWKEGNAVDEITLNNKMTRWLTRLGGMGA